ncbi:DUF1295 domain-containing protein [Dehalogenimonas sp. THU2]|uniref:DUF1295 domain-containing protein n=1 Tax=Dehalogenimonas sp. THU2 TaxID=3151121 RepID=UPI0032181C69
MDIANALILSGVIIFLYMTAMFTVAVQRRDNSVADIAWGPGFILVAGAAFIVAEDYLVRQALVLGTVTVWGLRLASRIYRRNRGKGEDPRYQQWREEWGSSWMLRSYLQVFLLQGFFMWLISLPVVVIMAVSSDSLGWPDLLGGLVWLMGFLFEAVADRQLDNFLSDETNRGKILQSGLWRYSRHPNYFGEVFQWWGIFLIALSIPGAWWTIAGPLTITWLILFVSGVPLLEKSMRRNPEFREYASRTSVFIPLPPKQ